jgi:hypothetical protein
MFTVARLILNSILTLVVRTINPVHLAGASVVAIVTYMFYPSAQLAGVAFVAGVAFAAVCTLVHMVYEFVQIAREQRDFDEAVRDRNRRQIAATGKQLSHRLLAVQDNYLMPSTRRTVVSVRAEVMEILLRNK